DLRGARTPAHRRRLLGRREPCAGLDRGRALEDRCVFRYDRAGDPALEPYCVLASQALRRTVPPDDEAGRQFGKTYDLAFGFGGGRGAWRKFDTSDTYSDAEIDQFNT